MCDVLLLIGCAVLAFFRFGAAKSAVLPTPTPIKLNFSDFVGGGLAGQGCPDAISSSNGATPTRNLGVEGCALIVFAGGMTGKRSLKKVWEG